MKQLGIMKKIEDLRVIWKHEAQEFTPWLAQEQNLKMLGETIGLDLVLEETESKVEEFSADIIAIDTNTSSKVIVENQLEDSNHTHLGQIITYAAGKSANIIIWIVKRAREAHRAAIEWLNNHLDEDIKFFLIEIELWQIGDSLIAPKFSVIEEPNNWAKEIKKVVSTDTIAKQARLKFWDGFNNYAFKNNEYRKEFNPHKATTDHWYNLNIGSSKCAISISYLIQRNEIVIEYYINNDKELFNKMYNHKDDIEAVIGTELDWRELPDKKASRIILAKDFDLTNDFLINSEYDWIMEYTIKFKKAFRKYILK